jgi:hypothetical protein
VASRMLLTPKSGGYTTLLGKLVPDVFWHQLVVAHHQVLVKERMINIE